MGIEELIFLHDFINMILVFIITFVMFIIITIILNSFINKNLLERQIIECIWTIIPAVILIQIAIPSLLLLYILTSQLILTSLLKPSATNGTEGMSTEISERLEIILKSNSTRIFPTNELTRDIFRLSDVDTRIVVPFNIHVRILISSANVLHAWTVPSLGVKADAVPGRLNQVKFIAQRAGVFFGQCSEICGANHRFIPIVLEIVNSNTFLNWIICAQD